ncbi:MAG: hypothetical protein AAF658_15490, partial [Myxococcota bacterium]
MLKLALVFELRALIRGRTGVLALVVFLAAGSLSIVLGERHVSQWREATRSSQEAGEKLSAEAIGFLEAGEPGPKARPWVNLAQPLWQDRYAGSRIARVPGALAGIASGSVDPAPAAFHIHRSADPMSASGYRIENPELAPGAVDLVFVLAILVPLLLGVLGLGIGGMERESGVDRLIAVQAGGRAQWWLARTVAVALVAASASVALCLAAAGVGGASLVETVGLAGVALLYVALWSGLLLAINARARSLRGAAFRFGLLWMVLCIFMPTLFAELAIGTVEDDFELDETLAVRALVEEGYEAKIETVLPKLYALYPKLQKLPAAAEDT